MSSTLARINSSSCVPARSGCRVPGGRRKCGPKIPPASHWRPPNSWRGQPGHPYQLGHRLITDAATLRKKGPCRPSKAFAGVDGIVAPGLLSPESEHRDRREQSHQRRHRQKSASAPYAAPATSPTADHSMHWQPQARGSTTRQLTRHFGLRLMPGAGRQHAVRQFLMLWPCCASTIPTVPPAGRVLMRSWSAPWLRYTSRRCLPPIVDDARGRHRLSYGWVR